MFFGLIELHCNFHPGMNKIVSCLVLSCLVLTQLVLCCVVLSCVVLTCLVLSCVVLSSFDLTCLVLSCLCLVLFCLVLSFACRLGGSSVNRNLKKLTRLISLSVQRARHAMTRISCFGCAQTWRNLSPPEPEEAHPADLSVQRARHAMTRISCVGCVQTWRPLRWTGT